MATELKTLRVLERKMMDRSVTLECDSLFGGTIEDAYGYLKAMHAKHVPEGVTARFVQNWSGYEDNSFELEWQTPETDAEYARSVSNAQWELEREERDRAAQLKVFEAKRAALRAEAEKLDAELAALSRNKSSQA